MSWINCTKKINHSKIKLDDPKGKRKAIFTNLAQTPFERTAADGCWKIQQLCADWVLTCCTSNAQVVVELKGSDTSHAIEQIVATLKYLSQEGTLGTPVAGLIVCTQYPSIDTKIQRAKISFKKQYNGPLHVVTKSQEFDIKRVVDFNGPH